MPRLWIMALALLGLGACSQTNKDPTANWTAEKLFEAARAEQAEKNYYAASDYYAKILTRYPYGTLAQQSSLDLVYTYYRQNEPEKASAELDSFIHLYPHHPQIAYAYYMRGIIAYDRNYNFFKRLNPVNLAQTDPNMLLKAFNAFKEVIEKFPDTEYAEDAALRMVYLRNLLGQHELEIAEHYLREGAFIAAIGRAQTVITEYQRTPSVPYALAVLHRAYKELNEMQRSADALAILRLNYPQMMNQREIQNYLNGDIKRKDSLFAILRNKPKI